MSDLRKTVDGIMSIVSDHLDGLPEAEQVERLKDATEVPLKESPSGGRNTRRHDGTRENRL